MDKNELRGRRANIVAEMETLVSAGIKTADQRTRFDALETEARDIATTLDAGQTGETGYRGTVTTTAQTPEERAFDRYVRTGDGSGLSEVRTDGQSTTPADGGYMIAQGFWDQLTVAMKAFSGFHDFYKQIETKTGAPMAYPTIDPTGVEGSIIGENDQLGNTVYAFGGGMMYAWAYTNDVVLASLQLVQDSEFDVQEFVSARCAESIGRKIAADSANGAGPGSQEPVGLYTALTAKGEASGASGGWVAGQANNILVPTLGNSTGTNELDGNILSPVTIQNMVKAIDPAYLPGAQWHFNATQVVNIRNIADQYGRPLYPEMRQANPTLEGFKVNITQAVSDLTSAAVSGPVFGDLSKAMVRRVARNASLLVLKERYADFLQMGYIAWCREDHQMLDLRAATTVVPAADS